MPNTIKPILQTMERLYKIHQSLLNLSQQKTEYLKTNNIQALQQLFPNERKHIQALETLEKTRSELVETWIQEHGPSGIEPTLSNLLPTVQDEEERKQLQAMSDEFILIMAEIKQQEALNRELTMQSLQFVELTMDMLQPTLKNMNYGNPNTKGSGVEPKRSVFDSKI
ncbi:flagellar protein FlgN [Bacillaceae bacterium S4-13-58]